MKNKNYLGFSLVELMISLIIISLVAAAFVPMITKKLKASTIISGGMASEISDQCEEKFGSDCKLCTKSYCVQCSKSCDNTTFSETKTCSCKSCSLKFSNCENCTSEKCTKCASDYYIKDNKCEKCEEGKFCNGESMSGECPYGYYCDEKGRHSCFDKFENCATCTKDKCTSCDEYYGFSNGKCIKCQGINCRYCYDNAYICNGCDGGVILENNNCIKKCSDTIANCYSCWNANTCYACNEGTFLTSNYKCASCTLSNCMKCKKYSDINNQKCSRCCGGYFVNSNEICQSCSSKYGSNCSACDSSKCLQCQKGYGLISSNQCEKNDTNQFKCSDSNFIKIGNLCFTRKNMGDSAILPIPSNVTTVEAGGEQCYSLIQNCCWKGETQGSCSSVNGDYSGCGRTVCNKSAAEEICKKFDFDGGGWRLPTPQELENALAIANYGIGNNGMMVCHNGWLSNNQVSTCTWAGDSSCVGAHGCLPYGVWTNQQYNPRESNYALIVSTTDIQTWHTFDYAALSVRCVKELSE